MAGVIACVNSTMNKKSCIKYAGLKEVEAKR
jgi:hypothetical protein